MIRRWTYYCSFWGSAALILSMFAAGATTTHAQNTFPTPSGNVGIGTTSPSNPLDVSVNQNGNTTILGINNSSAGVSAQAVLSFFEGSTQKMKFAVNSSGGTSFVGGADAFQIWNFMNSPIVFATNNAERMRIDGNGNVGIGTNDPNNGQSYNSNGHRLALVGTGSDSFLSYGTMSLANNRPTVASGDLLGRIDFLSLNNAGSAIASQILSTLVGSGGANGFGSALKFSTKGDNSNTVLERVRIDSTGNVGIGTASPLHAFSATGNTGFQGNFWYATNPGINIGDNVSHTAAGTKRMQLYVNTSSNYGSIQSLIQGSSYLPLVLNESGGNVGIGTTSPGYKLDVAGEIRSNTGFRFPDGTIQTTAASGGVSQWTTSGSNISYSSGNVGIGTSSPQRTLDLGTSGQLTFGNDGYSSTGSPGLFWYVDNTNYGIYKTAGSWSAPNYQQLMFNFPTGVVIDGGSAYGKSGTVLQPNGGNVGIGTSSPNYRLDLLGGFSRFAYNVQSLPASDNTNGGLAVGFNRTNAEINLYNLYENSTNTAFIFSQKTGANTANDLFTIKSNGNVGVGTTSPGYKLDVAGEIRSSTGFRFPDGTIQTTAASGGGGGVSSVFGRTGAVVAATNDYTWAQINKTTSSLADLTSRSASDLSSGTLPDARFPATLPAVSGANLLSLNASNLGSGTVAATRLGAGAADSTTFLRGDNTWATVQSSQWATNGSNINYATAGNVGIGQPTPNYKLDVNGTAHVSGNMTVDGNLAAKYQDVAEWVPSSEQLSAGTVVVLDPTKSNQVIASTQGYDTRVAGVVSERPGIALGEKSEGKVLVATTGRVHVKVDATKSPIHVGDLLVTSEVPGVAMKSEPVNLGGVQIHRPGTLIGKALEPLEKGKGEILVLLSLQ